MQSAPIPENEKERLISLHTLGLLDTKPEDRFDRITRTATKIFHVPISTLTLVDEKREWFKSVCGLNQKEGDRAISFCGHALLANEIFIILDTKKDGRFSDNPMVIGKPYIRFYAGVPIINADGERIGVFCIKDMKPRAFSKDDEDILMGLAAWAELEINSHNLSLALRKGWEIQAELKTQAGDLKNAKIAARNVFEDLSIEKLKMEIAKAKEEAILMSIGDGLLATDENGRIILINKTAEKLLGKKSEEVMAKVFSEVILMEDEKGVSIPMEKRPISIALAGTTTTTGPTYYDVRKDKTRYPVAMMVTPIILGGKVIGAIRVFRDITKEKEIDKTKTEFIFLASHQLKTPVTAINWLTERLLKGEINNFTAKQIEYFGDIRATNLRMTELVNALLNVSRIELIELGAFSIQPVKTNIILVIKNALHELKSSFDQNHLILKETYLPERLELLIDKQLFVVIINNLVINAIHYTPNSGTIEVACAKVDKQQEVGGQNMREAGVVISIKDTGYGIPERQQDKLFAKFFRADNAKERFPDGTGLGLYMVKSILDHSGGAIWFLSQEDKGSAFYVFLPLEGMKQRSGTSPLMMPPIGTTD
ncbi:MAG: ATP-binding protein [Patescibacteria group bacterium]